MESDSLPLRYLALGTSNTWGHGLGERHDAYPWLLSVDATNEAIRASGPNYPSVCTESIIGEEIYDVIVLEFFAMANAGLVPLAQRLRRRFPDATIVFLAVWNPAMIYYQDEAEVGLKYSNLKWDWSKKTGNEVKSPASLEAFEKSPNQWMFLQDYMNQLSDAVEEARRLVNGYTLKWDWKGDARDLLLQRHQFFADDWHHLSKEGHLLIAKGIHGILRTRARPKRSDTLGDWGHGDFCNSWYETGQTTIQHSHNILMNNFHVGQPKFALEIPPEGGTITVNNPFQDLRKLMLTYMATGPSTTIYPMLEVQYQSQDNHQKVLIHPLVKNAPYPLHITQSINIGTIPPGQTLLKFQPWETTQEPFRIVAISVLSIDAVITDEI